MSLSLWTVNCSGIQKERLTPALRWRQALDASAIHGRLGAQVALLQSPILPDACSPYNKRPELRDLPLINRRTDKLKKLKKDRKAFREEVYQTLKAGRLYVLDPSKKLGPRSSAQAAQPQNQESVVATVDIA
jgi:hypothetical protein